MCECVSAVTYVLLLSTFSIVLFGEPSGVFFFLQLKIKGCLGEVRRKINNKSSVVFVWSKYNFVFCCKSALLCVLPCSAHPFLFFDEFVGKKIKKSCCFATWRPARRRPQSHAQIRKTGFCAEGRGEVGRSFTYM